MGVDMSLNRSIRWRGLDPVTLEHCHVISTARDTRIRGTIVTPDYGLFYRIKLDDREHVRTVRLERTDGKVLELFSDGAGDWSDDRAEPLPDLRHCLDIDIWPTPFTNTFPMRRVPLSVGERREFRMAWVFAPDLTVQAQPQAYTRLAERLYRFESLDGSGFEVQLPVVAV